MRGVADVLGARETAASFSRDPAGERVGDALPSGSRLTGVDAIVLPSYDEVKYHKLPFVEATRLIHINTNPLNPKTLEQLHHRQAVLVNPPCAPLSPAG